MILSNSCVLNERYSIQSVLGEVGPFDVNYLAWDLQDEKEVVVREYYPVRLAKRASDGMSIEVHDADLFEYGLGAYSAEGLVLNKLKHKYIAGCQEPFKQNGTVYCVHNYISGAPLRAYLKQQEGKLSEEEALPIIEKVLQALQASHARKLYHGGVNPKSILINREGDPILLGFQGARFKIARECEDLKDIIKPGYSAPEQTTYEADEGPWWDIYGSAATLFHILTGNDLPEATDGWSSNKIKVALYRDGLLSSEMCDVLVAALSFTTADRPADAEVFQAMLLNTQRVTRQLHEGDGVPRFEVGYTAEISPQEAVWQNGVEVTAAKITIETEESPAAVPVLNEKEVVESEMPNVVPSNSPQMLQTSSPHKIARNELQTHEPQSQELQPQELQPHEPQLHEAKQTEPASQRSSGREQELEVLLTRMVKWQQVFVAFILGIVVIALLGLVGGVFFGTDLFQRSANQPAQVANGIAPPQATGPASAQAAVSPGGDTPLNELPEDQQSAVSAAASIPVSVSEETEEAREASASQVEASPETDNSSEADDSILQNASSEESSPDEVTSETATNDPSDNSQTTAEAGSGTGDEGVFFTDEDLGLSIEAPDTVALIVSDETVKVDEQERLFNYYRVQGDSLMNQGFTVAALQWYQNAKKYKNDDRYINEQISVITESISTQERNAKAADSLTARLQQVRDEAGIFVTPDTPVGIVDEQGMRAQIKYPISAVNGRVSGRVILRYMVDEEGQLQDVKVVRGPGWGTEDVVIELLRDAEFIPATFNGERVKAWATFSTVFKL